MTSPRDVATGRLRPPDDAPESGERVEVLSAGRGWRVEQILSGRLAAPVEDLLDHVEWVVVVSGRAVLELDGSVLTLAAGDWVRIGPALPHRVLSTEPGTNWLAVHVELDGAGPAGQDVRPR